MRNMLYSEYIKELGKVSALEGSDGGVDDKCSARWTAHIGGTVATVTLRPGQNRGMVPTFRIGSSSCLSPDDPGTAIVAHEDCLRVIKSAARCLARLEGVTVWMRDCPCDRCSGKGTQYRSTNPCPKCEGAGVRNEPSNNKREDA